MKMIFFFVKFFDDEKYVNDFISGKLFANRLSYFKNIEKDEYVSRGDRHEGVVNWLQPDRVRLAIDGQDITGDLAGPVGVQMNWLGHLNVFCIYAAHSGDFRGLSSENIGDFKKQLMISEDCLKLGKYAVVITNVSKFIGRIETAAKARSYRVCRGLVEYYNPETFHGSFSGKEAIFMKRDEYSYQKEYRLAIDTGVQGNNPIILDIGDITDISMPSNVVDINKNLEIRLHIKEH